MRYRHSHNVSLSFSSGFTLIEILIVLVIIAILAAILLPVFAMCAKTPRRTVAPATCKQLVPGNHPVHHDNNNRLPAPPMRMAPDGRGAIWAWIVSQKYGVGD
jgi:prepilin-type N-terminal cleavage/methylation domain-containing protein